MRATCWAALLVLGLAGSAWANDPPPTSVPIPGPTNARPSGKVPEMPRPRTASRHMSTTRLGVGDFFRRLFAPKPNINGTPISGIPTYNRFEPLPPVSR